MPFKKSPKIFHKYFHFLNFAGWGADFFKYSKKRHSMQDLICFIGKDSFKIPNLP